MYDPQVASSRSWKSSFWIRLDKVKIHERKKQYILKDDVDYWKENFRDSTDRLDGFLPVVNECDLSDSPPSDDITTIAPQRGIYECLPVVQISKDDFEAARKTRRPRRHHRPCLEVSGRDLTCLDGQCRLEARKSEAAEWGLVNIVLDGKYPGNTWI